MTTPVLVGGSTSFDLSGVEGARLFHRLRFGDLLWTEWPRDAEDLQATLAYCREHEIRIAFREIRRRGVLEFRPQKAALAALTRAERERILTAAAPAFLWRQAFGEVGGTLYWPKGYTLNRSAGEWGALPAVATADRAKEQFMALLREFLAFERDTVARTKYACIDSSFAIRYVLEAGIDLPILEMMPGDPQRLVPMFRGAAKAYGKPWAAHIAMGCYGGVNFDPLWLKRWRTALNYAFVTGAQAFWMESGHLDYDQHRGQAFAITSPEMKAVRRILREAWQFVRVHSRPERGPRAAIAVVAGHLDGAPGLWNPYAWGQYTNKKWHEGPPEHGWRLVEQFYRKENWANEAIQGETDFSGQPPWGQFDIVPAEATLEVLKGYAGLVFLGWNTMTAEQYERLRAYVTAGGHLVMWLPHLSTHTDRAHDLKLFRNGDFRDLFGVHILGKGRKEAQGVKCFQPSTLESYRFPLWRTNTDPRFIGHLTPAPCRVSSGRVISGWADYYNDTEKTLAERPAIIENSLGRGKAFLVAAWEYPADPGLIKLTHDILRTVIQGEQGDIRLLSSDRVRYAVYDDNAPDSRRPFQVLYLLNTDPDCEAAAQLWINGKTSPALRVPANALRVIYRCGELLLAFSDKRVDLAGWASTGKRQTFTFYSVKRQTAEAVNLGDVPLEFALNGKNAVCRPGQRVRVTAARHVDTSRQQFFAPGFLREPSLTNPPPPDSDDNFGVQPRKQKKAR